MKILYAEDMNQLLNAFKLYLDRLLVPIDDPGSRLFYLNLLMTVVFVFIYAVILSKGRSPILLLKRWFFQKKYWWNRSTKIDYQVYFLNGLFKVFLFIPWLDFSYFFSKKTVQSLKWMSADVSTLAPTHFNLFSFTIFAFVIDDFLRFIHHWCMHKIPWLWRFHKTHHSAKILTPITLYRAHPVEVLLSTLRNSLSAGLAVGFFVYFFEAQVSYFQVLSVNFFGFTFNFLGSNLRHSHIPISFGFLESIFISPKQHQIHHSRNNQHYDKNFGVSLAMWDSFAGSLVRSKEVNEKIHFGVRGFSQQNLKKILFPF